MRFHLHPDGKIIITSNAGAISYLDTIANFETDSGLAAPTDLQKLLYDESGWSFGVRTGQIEQIILSADQIGLAQTTLGMLASLQAAQTARVAKAEQTKPGSS